MQRIALFFFLLVALAACHTTKKIGDAIKPKGNEVSIPDKDYLDSIQQMKSVFAQFKKNRIDYRTFSTKIKIESSGANGKNPDMLAVVRMIKDSAIWVSLSATILNVEVFRVFITKDSVILLNKQDKEVQFRSMDYLQEVTQVPFDFNTLQEFLVGNPVFITDSICAYRKVENKIMIATVGDFFKSLFTIDANDMRMMHCKMDDVQPSRNRTADITYDEFEWNEGRMFSASRAVSVSEKNRLDIDMKYKQTEFNKELSLQFNIPKNYKRK